MLKILPCLLALPYGSATMAAESSGEAAFARGDYSIALDRWRAQAQTGNASAMRALGMLYDTGHGVPQDFSTALSWYRSAAQAGDAEAAFNVATMYDVGRGVPMDRAQAIRWYRIAADRGVGRAAYNLGVIYRDGDGTPRDRDAAIRYFRQAAKAGLAAAAPSLAALGAPLKPPLSPAQPKVAQQPQTPAPRRAEPFTPEVQQELEAISAFLTTALARKPLPAALAGTFAEYVPTFQEEADQDDHMAEYNLGYAYQYGVGVERDPVKSYAYYSRAASSDIPEVIDAAKAGLRDISASLSPAQQSQAREMAANNPH